MLKTNLFVLNNSLFEKVVLFKKNKTTMAGKEYNMQDTVDLVLELLIKLDINTIII